MNAFAQSSTSATPVALLRTLVLCDLVDSTAQVERLGDQRAAEWFRRHDRLARSLLSNSGGREIDKTDGFLVMFDRPVQGVAFALDYLRGLKQLAAEGSHPPAARVGIHVGDVIAWDNAPDDIAKGAKPVEIEFQSAGGGFGGVLRIGHHARGQGKPEQQHREQFVVDIFVLRELADAVKERMCEPVEVVEDVIAVFVEEIFLVVGHGCLS